MREVIIVGALLIAAAAVAAPAPSKAPGSQPAKKTATPAPRPLRRSAPPLAGLSVEEILQKSKDPLRRESAALVLGVRGGDASLPLLRKALAKDPDKWVRTRVAEALGMIGDPAAIPWLHTALSGEKEPRVRRTIAAALLRLGQSAGVKELVWQLKSGTNYTKAETMLFLVEATGEPLGQDTEAWWDYFNERGGVMKLARRPIGSPALLPLRGVVGPGPKPGAAAGPYLHARKAFGWRQVPAVVLELGPRREPVSQATLVEHEKQRGKIPDGCLLLLRTDWRDAKKAAPRAPIQTKKLGDTKVPRPMEFHTTEPPVPWLEPDAVAFLLKRAPKLVGVGMDTPHLDPRAATGTARPARDALLAADKLALESVGDLDRLVANGTRLILFRQGAAPAVTILAVLP
jgi:kynurenine formamidase